ncbi:MAG: hypothetical protein AAF481_10895 [Acidobacteriota bacterium]
MTTIVGGGSGGPVSMGVMAWFVSSGLAVGGGSGCPGSLALWALGGRVLPASPEALGGGSGWPGFLAPRAFN